MPTLPEPTYRLKDILHGDPDATPPVPPLLPMSESAWFDGVKAGRLPKPIKLGRCAFYRASDILALLERA